MVIHLFLVRFRQCVFQHIFRPCHMAQNVLLRHCGLFVQLQGMVPAEFCHRLVFVGPVSIWLKHMVENIWLKKVPQSISRSVDQWKKGMKHSEQ